MVFNVGMTDSELIEKLGGASKLAKRLGYGVQRVNNWKKRGIPAQAKVDFQSLLLKPSKQTAKAA